MALFNVLHNTEWDGKMISADQLVRIWKEHTSVSFKAISR